MSFSTYIIYFLLVAAIPLWAQYRVKTTYAKYAKVGVRSGLTGAEVARMILDRNGLSDIPVRETNGILSDHYDPGKKTVFLSSSNYNGRTIAGAAVAAHEVGHVIQDKEGYTMMRLRSALVPATMFSSNISWVFLLIGMFANLSGLMLIGIILMAVGVLFQLVTLPVEFDASKRALVQLESGGFVTADELPQAKQVLSAAAMTYVAAMAVAVLELLRLLLIFTNMNRN
ncbi:zinc metallopeptidase [Listeria ilorinensis]|uniref:zinc metallopeptidase n=1 Tax=Listeria ilorinensis TaxID=2867439 RepID=UPI001EF64D9E|nr:zinc metallopeptidase [Listeria ilorinensis]